uniref:Uncharacterized protein n=1 Tax=viral metagenome TaxID=1070528 RepID=A0A6C0EBJ9_9ZZZZ
MSSSPTNEHDQFNTSQLNQVKSTSNHNLFDLPTYKEPPNDPLIPTQSGGNNNPSNNGIPNIKEPYGNNYNVNSLINNNGLPNIKEPLGDNKDKSGNNEPFEDNKNEPGNNAGENNDPGNNAGENNDPENKESFGDNNNAEEKNEDKIPQFGGSSDFNPEGMDLNDSDEVQIEESGNPSNPGEDSDPTDHPEYDLIKEEKQEAPEWIHPDLSIEDDYDMVSRMNQEEIESRVNTYLENYHSDEYAKYQKYFQSCYSASTQKYSIRKDNKGNIYLCSRAPQKENKGKKVKENVNQVFTDTEFTKNYLIKLTPPQYCKVSQSLKDITNELNIVSGDIKLLQQELIEQGAEIHDEDIKHFKKLRRKFYKLINKKYVYTKYYQEINGLNVTEAQTPVYAKEIITDIDENDNKIYKFKTHMVNASETLIQNMSLQIKEDLKNYTNIMHHNRDNQKEYQELIKFFLNEKKNNQEKIQKELSTLVSLQKERIDYLIEKLPIIDIRKDPFN